VPAHGDDPNTLANRLAQVQEQQALQSQRLLDLQRQQAGVQLALSGLQAQLADANAELAPVAARAQELQAQLEEAEGSLVQAETSYAAHRKSFHTDVRRIYQIGSLGWLEFFLSAHSFNDLLSRTVYFEHLMLSEFEMSRRLKAEGEALEAQRRLLAQRRDELAPVLKQLQTRAAAIANAVSTAATYDTQLDSLRRQTMVQVAGLQSQGQRLQAALDRYQAEQAELALKRAGSAYGVSCPPAAPAGSVRFCGHGWGHGVGLGQWGADGMALAGYNYRAIAQHFYTGTSWATVDSVNTPIHVAVLWGASQYRVVTSGPAQLEAGGRISPLASGQAVNLTASGGLQKVVPLSGATRLAVYGPGGLYHRYRGTIVGQPGGGLFYIINVLSIEDYLRGLGEVPSSWPLDAIKAQVVAARCYALTHLGTNALYDVDDSTQFQVYLGADNESSTQNAAVDQTVGQVLTYGGRVIIAFFSASDGGHTANVSDVWGGSLATYPYLTGVLDPWDVVAPRHTWYTEPYSYATLERVYFSGVDVATYGRLVRLDLSDRDASDRLNTVGLVGSKGVKRIGSDSFLRIFNRSPLTGTDVLWNEMFGTTPSNTWRYW
jgi:stage II sporulation protein D